MKNTILFPFTLLLLALLLTGCNDDDNKDENTAPDEISTPAQLTAALQDVYEQRKAPGFTVAVVQDNQLVYQQSFGKADVEADRAYTNQTTQSIGSISKTFVAAALVKAVEQGYFTLNTDINELLPVEIINPKQPDGVIRVRDLVTHTSGLIDNYEIYLQAYHVLPGEDMSSPGAQLLVEGLGMQQRETIPMEAFLADYYLEDGDAYTPDNFAATAPGSSWNYSNIATALAAYLVEVSSGTPFDIYVETFVLRPLGMDATAYEAGTEEAKLYWGEQTPLPAYHNDFYADGSIHSSNEDLSKYLLDMLKGAQGQSARLFSVEGYQLLFDALLPEGVLPASIADNQGIYWFLDATTIGHTGGDPGTSCELSFDPDGKHGFFLLSNMDASTQAHQQEWGRLSSDVKTHIAEFLNSK